MFKRRLFSLYVFLSFCLLPILISARRHSARTTSADKEEITSLIHNLQSKDLPIRTAAANALGDLGPAAISAAPALIESVRSDNVEETYFWNGDYRRSVVAALCHIGPSVIPALKKGLHTKSNQERCISTLALSRLDPEIFKRKLVLILIKDLKEKNTARQRETILTLGEMGPLAKKATPALIHVLLQARKDQRNQTLSRQSDLFGFVRTEAAQALGKIGSDAAINPLVDELRPDPVYMTFDKKSDAPYYAGEALINIGERAVPALTRTLHENNPLLRQRVGEILGRLGTKAKSSSIALKYLLQMDEIIINPVNKDVRSTFVEALSRIDPAAKEDAVSIIRAREIRPGDGRFTHLIMNTPLPVITTQLNDETLHYLSRALQYEDVLIRRRASEILLAIGKKAEEAVPGLSWALFDADEQVRMNATVTLGNIGSEAWESCPFLAQVLIDSEFKQKVEAARSLEEIGPSDPDVFYQMLQATKDKDKIVRQLVRDVLTKIGLDHPDALAKAMQRVQDE